MPSGSRAWRTLIGLVTACGWFAAGGHAQIAAPERLSAGSNVEWDTQRDAPHRYELPLSAGQYVEITLTDNLSLRNLAPPEALDLTLRTSSGDTVRRFSRETSTSGARRACFVAEKADTYTVIVSATQSLRYTLHVVAIREAAAVDRTRSRAV